MANSNEDEFGENKAKKPRDMIYPAEDQDEDPEVKKNLDSETMKAPPLLNHALLFQK